MKSGYSYTSGKCLFDKKNPVMGENKSFYNDPTRDAFNLNLRWTYRTLSYYVTLLLQNSKLQHCQFNVICVETSKMKIRESRYNSS